MKRDWRLNDGAAAESLLPHDGIIYTIMRYDVMYYELDLKYSFLNILHYA